MTRSEIQQWLAELSRELGWRHLPDSHEALGIHEGVGFHVQESEGELYWQVVAPGSNVSDEILNDFRGFSHWAEAGLPTTWICGRIADNFSCEFTLSDKQLEQVGWDRFCQLPHLLAHDFHACGAVPELACSKCAEHIASDVMVVGFHYQLLCQFCRKLLAIQTVKGTLASPRHVSWSLVWPRLLGMIVAGVLVWSFWLNDQLRKHGEFDLNFAGMTLGAWGLATAYVVSRTQTQLTLSLRIMTAFALGSATLAVNLTVYYFYLRTEDPLLRPFEFLKLYFTTQLRTNFEYLLLIAAPVGSVAGYIFLDKYHPVRVR